MWIQIYSWSTMTHYPNEQILGEALRSFCNWPQGLLRGQLSTCVSLGEGVCTQASRRVFSGEQALNVYCERLISGVGGGGGGGGMGLITKFKKHIETSYCSYMAVPRVAVLIKMRFEFTPFFNLQNVVKKIEIILIQARGLITEYTFFRLSGRLAYNLEGWVA